MILQKIDLESLQEFADPNSLLGKQAIQMVQDMSSPHFQLKQLGISSKILSDWEALGIINRSIADEHTEVLVEVSNQKRKWRRFTFFEMAWISFVAELKKYGVELDAILELKRKLFPASAEEIIAIYKSLLERDHITNEEKELFEKQISSIEQNKSQINYELKSLKRGVFTGVVIAICLKGYNVIFFNNDNLSTFFKLGDAVNNEQAELLREIIDMANNQSFAIINLRQLVLKLYDNEKVDIGDEYFFNLMNSNEQAVIKKIRSGLYKEIIVKMEDGEMRNLRLKKKDNDELIRTITRQMKKGEYKHIEFIIKDGIAVSAEETEIIKLKK